jgi:hypothetical protein
MSAETETTPKKMPDVREFAVDKLAEHLAVGVSLAQLCEDLANKTNGDRLGPIYAAARIMRANAAVAEVLATVGGIERRRRSIVERVPAPKSNPNPDSGELNSGLQKIKSPVGERMERFRQLNAEIERAAAMKPGENCTDEDLAKLRSGIEAELALLENDVAGENEGTGKGDG